MSSHTADNTPDPSLKCSYANGRCNARRAVKANGNRHRFCERHWDQAYEFQRKHVQKRRERIEITNQRTNNANAESVFEVSIDDLTSSAFLPIDNLYTDLVYESLETVP